MMYRSAYHNRDRVLLGLVVVAALLLFQALCA